MEGCAFTGAVAPGSCCFLRSRTRPQQNKRKRTGCRIDNPRFAGLCPGINSEFPKRNGALDGGDFLSRGKFFKKWQNTSFLMKNNCPANHASRCFGVCVSARISSLKYVHFSVKRARVSFPVSHVLCFHWQRLQNQRDEFESPNCRRFGVVAHWWKADRGRKIKLRAAFCFAPFTNC